MSSEATLETIPGAITAPDGFSAAGVFCGVGGNRSKGRQRPDLALIVGERPGAVAGTFTTNRICASPVRTCMRRMERGVAQAVVANSGNANACTGPRGDEDAETMARETARHLGIDPGLVLPASTGRIGVPLPMERIRRGIAAAARDLAAGEEGARRAAEAIMTSDTFPKEAAVEVECEGRRFRIGGIAKGAGMIAPDMHRKGPLHATMLAFLTTDLTLDPSLLQLALDQAVDRSFNCISVDGDMSTNDTVLLLSGGREHPVDSEDSPHFLAFRRALNELCRKLARCIVADGEGTARTVTVLVEGARNDEQAAIAARAVAGSQLVKTSWAGGDPNWGRILAALGACGVDLEEDSIDIAYSNGETVAPVPVIRSGVPSGIPFPTLCDIVAPKEFDLHVHLNLGRGTARHTSCDLTEEYVRFNRGDISDPGSMGG